MKICLTLVLSCVVVLAGTLWVHGQENEDDG